MVQSLDPMFEQVQRFASVRRREVRVALLQEAGRDADDWKSHRDRVPDAVSAFNQAIKMLSDHAESLRSTITPQLDDTIAFTASEDHPLRKLIVEKSITMGFTREEADWMFKELAAIKYRPVQLLCADGFDDLTALLAGISVGEGGLLLAGFPRFTQDPDVDKRLEKIIIRFREHGVTASVFLVIVIVIAAHSVASTPNKGRKK